MDLFPILVDALNAFSRSVIPWLATYAIHSTIFLGLAYVTLRWVIRDPHARDLVLRIALVAALLTSVGQMTPLPSPPVVPLPSASDARADARGIEQNIEVVVHAESEETQSDNSGEAHVQAPSYQPAHAARAALGHEPGAALATPGHEPGAALATSQDANHAETQALPATRVEITRDWVTDPASTVAAHPRVHWTSWLALAWLLGAALSAPRHIRHVIALRRLLRDRRPVTSPLLRSRLASLSREAGLRRPVSLTTSDRIDDALALGAGEICISSRLLHDLAEGEQISTLAHEVAHLRRRDPLWVALARGLASCFFFQPLHHWAAKAVREEAEYICDAWAVRHTQDPAALARSLLKVVLLRERRMPLPAVAAGMAHGESTLVRRARRILRGGGAAARGRARACTLGAACVMILVGLLAPRAVLSLENNTGPVAREPGRARIEHVYSTRAAELSPLHDIYGLSRAPRALPLMGDAADPAIAVDPSTPLLPSAPGDTHSIVIESDDGTRRQLDLTRREDGGFDCSWTIDGEQQPFDEEAVDLLLDLLSVSVGRAGREAIFTVDRHARAVAPALLPPVERGGVGSGNRTLPSLFGTTPASAPTMRRTERETILERIPVLGPKEVPRFLRRLGDEVRNGHGPREPKK